MKRAPLPFADVDWNRIFHDLRKVWWPMSRVSEATGITQYQLSNYRTGRHSPLTERAEKLVGIYALATSNERLPTLRGSTRPIPEHLIPKRCHTCGASNPPAKDYDIIGGCS
jgi:hypothetical protein